MLNQIITTLDKFEGTMEDSRIVIEELKSIPDLKFIGRGSSRAVFKRNSYVYKIPISSTGKTQNTTSKRIYDQLSSNNTADVVAPVIRLQESVLKQEYCPITRDSDEKERVIEKLNQYGYKYRDWDDSSVGMCGGLPVLVDIAGLEL